MKAMLLLVAVLAACGWHADASAQAKVPRVGVFSQGAGAQPFFQAFERYLAGRGWTNGKNVTLEYRTYSADAKELSKIAEEFVRLKVDVIHASAAPLVRVAYAATRSIPIVGLDFTNDPVAVGYAESYNRPGRNVTGIFLDAPELAGKWLQILRELKPGLSRVGVLWERGPGPAHLRALESAAKTFKVDLKIVEVRKADEFEQAVGAS
jgi:putative tryptophan/tyrosine transport system substrate-binding protein